MGWYRCTGGSGGTDIVYKNYIKFNGTGVILPWTLNSDYKIECVFYDTVYYNDSCITATTSSNYGSEPYIAQYGNHYDVGTGSGYTNLGAWSVGEHTYINNNENDKNVLDGTEGAYTPKTGGYYYTIGCRGGATQLGYYNYVKSYKIYSKSTGDLLHDLKPCLIKNLAAFHDVVDDGLYTSAGLTAVDTPT